MKTKNKPNLKKKLVVFLAVVFLFLLVFYLKANKITGLVGQENYYFFSNQALLNGINASRGYGAEVGLNNVIPKLLFNKSFFLIMYLFELVNRLFHLFISLVKFLIN